MVAELGSKCFDVAYQRVLLRRVTRSPAKMHGIVKATTSADGLKVLKNEEDDCVRKKGGSSSLGYGKHFGNVASVALRQGNGPRIDLINQSVLSSALIDIDPLIRLLVQYYGYGRLWLSLTDPKYAHKL
jgi:hypothetical protein